jgi:hypothetical protein
MRRDADHGTNADGSLSADYCSLCFKNGAFTEPNISMEEKIEQMVIAAQKMNILAENVRTLSRTLLPQLKRWKGK